eukprot:6198046-Pleurochrysis_carterae.AAC.6
MADAGLIKKFEHDMISASMISISQSRPSMLLPRSDPVFSVSEFFFILSIPIILFPYLSLARSKIARESVDKKMSVSGRCWRYRDEAAGTILRGVDASNVHAKQRPIAKGEHIVRVEGLRLADSLWLELYVASEHRTGSQSHTPVPRLIKPPDRRLEMTVNAMRVWLHRVRTQVVKLVQRPRIKLNDARLSG